MDHILQLNEFFIEGGDQSKSHVLLHISEPSTPEEKEKGYFFAICEINNAETRYITELQDIIDKVENEYYELADDPNKTALEKILEKVNQETIALVKPSVELHCIIGAIRQPEIIFTYYGKPHILLFYKNRNGVYQKMDLLAGNEEPANDHQMFSSLIQGKISAQDFFVAATPHLSDYFSADRLEKIITTRPVQQSIQHIERVLSELRDGFSFGGVILHLSRAIESAAAPKKIPPRSVGGSQKSLTNLFSTEQQTASTLSPSLWPRLNDKMKSLLKTNEPEQPQPAPTPVPPEPRTEIASAHLRPHRRNDIQSEPQQHFDWNKLQAVFPIILRGGLAFLRGIWWILITIVTLISSFFRFLALLFFVITNYQNRRRLIVENWQRQWASYKSTFSRMTLITKILFVGALVFIILFALSIVYLKHRAKTVASQKQFSDALTMVETKKDSAESFLIYHNEASALTELQSAEEILSNLTCASKADQARCSELKTQLQALFSRARRVSVVKPTLLADWSQVNDFASSTSIIKTNGTLYAVSGSTSSVASFNLLTSESKLIATDARNKGYAEISTPKENDYILLTSVQGNLIALNPTDNSVKSYAISYPVSGGTPVANIVYNRRLYVLDASHNQIYKFDSIKDGFGTGKEWIKDSTVDLRDGSDIAIDGDAFVVKNNGTILKFTSGSPQPFAIQGLEPALGPNDRIWTYTDANYLYVLDPTQKRLVILDKEGRVKTQITANEFNRPTGLAIDEPNHFAYILDSGKLYKVSLPE